MCSSQLRLMASEVNTAHSEINRLSGTFFCVFSLRLPLPIFFCSFEVLTTLLPSPRSTPLNGEQRDHSPVASTLFQDLRGSVHVFVRLMCPKRLDEVREGRQPLVFARCVCRTSQNRERSLCFPIWSQSFNFWKPGSTQHSAECWVEISQVGPVWSPTYSPVS